MADDEFEEIEYLDEDADLVQQCVQVVPVPVPPVVQKPPATSSQNLLVERQRVERKRKKTRNDDDSDYDPKHDNESHSPVSSKAKKRKTPTSIKKAKSYQSIVPNTKPGSVRSVNLYHVPPKTKDVVSDRKKCNIRIPDYDDPLCLPVRAIKQDKSNLNRLNNWNNVCLEHFKQCDNLLKPEQGITHSSVRTMVFRNVMNKQTGQKETTIWSKTCVENKDGDRKSEIFQCILPRYKEKKVLTMYGLGVKRPKPYYMKDEVILNKEVSKEGEILVAYKPNDATSSVFKLVVPDAKKLEPTDEEEEKPADDTKMYMKEVAYTKMCVPCYQTSWRGVKKNKNVEIECPVCGRSYGTAYNLITHFKTHKAEDIRTHKHIISSILGGLVDYHYKCRVCLDQFSSIKKLRKHVTTHQGKTPFICEVGNHRTQ